MKKVSDFADVMTKQDFLESVECGMFIDDDGIGHPVMNGLEDTSIYVYPSQVKDIPEWATHIAWYNK